MTRSKELLDELLKGCERPEDLLGDAGLMKEFKIKLMERKLCAVHTLTAYGLFCDSEASLICGEFLDGSYKRVSGKGAATD